MLAAGGGFKRGTVVGATDKLGEQVTDKFYKVESFGRTLYHLLGIDPDTIVTPLNNRPINLIAEDAPIINAHSAFSSGRTKRRGAKRELL